MFAIIRNIGNKFIDGSNKMDKSSVYTQNNAVKDPQLGDNIPVKQNEQTVIRTFKSYYA